MKAQLSRVSAVTVAALLGVWPVSRAAADGGLPYTARSKSFNGFNSSVRGDIRTVGMSGAAVGLADTFIAGTYNPAGLAMTLDTADANFASQVVHDGAIEGYAAAIHTDNFGASVNLYPWGFSLGTVAPYTEGQIYTPAGQPANGLETSVTIREGHLGAARLFGHDRFSLGVDLIIGQATEVLNPLADPSRGGSAKSLAVGATVGGLYHISHGFLFGMSVSLPMHYAGDTSLQPTPALPGFLKPVEVPGRIGFGLGWIPNRFVRLDLTTYVVGTIPNAALIRDETAAVGGHFTAEPRLGLAYNFIELRELRATFFAGMYHEVSRIAGSPGRTHGTWGVELHPWLLTIGWGMDTADSYQSYLASIGVDLVRLMAKLDVIPTPWRAPPEGVLPNPFQYSTAGLARALDPDWKPRGDDMNPFKVGLGVPKGLQQVPSHFNKTFQQTEDDLKETGQDLLDTVRQLPGRVKNIIVPPKKDKKAE